MVAVRIPTADDIQPVRFESDLNIRPRASAADFGGAIGKAGEQLGTSIENVGAAVGHIAAKLRDQRQATEDTVAQSTFETDYAPRARQAFLDAQKQFPEGGDGFTADLDKRLVDAQGQSHQALSDAGIQPSAAATARIQAHADNHRTAYLVQGVTWENNQKVASLEAQLDDNADKIAADVLASGDVDGGLARARQALEAQRGFVPADKIRIKSGAYEDKIADAAIQHAIASQDFDRARELTARFFGAVPNAAPAAGTANLQAADEALHLTSQEKALYQRHLQNLTGPGGVDNPNGSRSTIYQMSFERDGKVYNIPTVWDGKILKPDAAIARAEKEGLDKFPSYGSEQEAESRYQQIHTFMERDTAAYLQSRGGRKVDYPTRLFQIESGGNPNAVTGSNRGLGQFGPEEEKRFGITDANRTDPQAQLRAVQREAAENGPKLAEALGREPTPGELYLAHQQGLAGAVAILTHPDQPAWEAIRPYYSDKLARSKGFASGDDMAKAAIEGNTYDALKSVPVEQRTGQQFASLWINKFERGSGPENPNVGKAVQWSSRIASASAVDRKQVQATIDDDLSSISETGQGVPSITHDRIATSLGKEAADTWLDSRQRAKDYWTATQDFATLPLPEIIQRVGSLAPKPGEDGYLERQHWQELAQKKADSIIKARNEDPAGSVASDSEVQKAAANARFDNPDSIKALVQARYAAQERAGIPEEGQSPITHAEALQMSAPLRRMLPGQELDTLRDLGKHLRGMFGDDDAATAFEYVLRVHRVEAATAQKAGTILRKLMEGKPLEPTAARELDGASEIAAADKAVYGFSGGNGQSYSEAMTGALNENMPPVEPPPAPTMSNIAPARAISALRANPNLAGDFDAKFGKGASAKVLEGYPLGVAAKAPEPTMQPAPPVKQWNVLRDETGALAGFAETPPVL